MIEEWTAAATIWFDAAFAGLTAAIERIAADPSALGYLTILGVVLVAAALIGFLSARSMYQRRLRQRTAAFSEEIIRLRRQVSIAESRSARLKRDIDRDRRRRVSERI